MDAQSRKYRQESTTTNKAKGETRQSLHYWRFKQYVLKVKTIIILVEKFYT